MTGTTGTGFGSRRSTSHQLPPVRMESRGPQRVPDACYGAAGHGHGGHHLDEMPVKACLVPKELYEHIVEAGVTKTQWRLDKQIAMGLIAAFYIGFSFTLMMVVGGQIPTIQKEHPGIYNLVLGAFGFPLGLFMICVVGADLFTSNCSYLMVAVFEGRATWWHLIKSWTLSWFVNCAGSIIMAAIVYWAWIFHGRDEFTLALAEKKAHYPFSVCMCKAILANWLVNLAVWIANSAQDVTGKAIGIYLPISAFITIGGEHCIANQFLFALYKFLGGEMSVNHIIVHNLIPSTIGNAIGGAFFVGTMYSFAVGTLFDSIYSRALPPGSSREKYYKHTAAHMERMQVAAARKWEVMTGGCVSAFIREDSLRNITENGAVDERPKNKKGEVLLVVEGPSTNTNGHSQLDLSPFRGADIMVGHQSVNGRVSDDAFPVGTHLC